ncbi:MAG: hypothetical protein JJE13_08830 [Thermoleophilia bacterium]|nr:hypothetical protein [Thermoleophilia bacterium]
MAASARQMSASALPAVLPAPGRRRPRSTPARRPSPQRRQRHGGRRLVGRTAHAVTHLPETRPVVGISRSRVWIAVIGVLLTGLVSINVMTVSYGASSSKVDAQIQSLERRNAILKSTETEVLSMPRVHDTAVAAGMAVPDPQELRYLHFKPGDIAAAAQRLAAEGG